MNEFKLAMANLAANNASGASSRAGSFAYFGSGTGTARCPSTWRTSTAARMPTNPAAYANAGDHLGEHDDRRPARGAEPEPQRGSRATSTAT